MVRTVAVDSRFYELQADVAINQANPVSGTLYELLPETTMVRVIEIASQCTWTVQPTPLQTWATISGVEINFNANNPVSVTEYYPAWGPFAAMNAQGNVNDINQSRRRAFLIEDKLVLVQLEVTGGTVQFLAGRLKYQRYI